MGILADLEDPTKFIREPRMAVFDEHVLQDGKGNVIRRVEKVQLERYAALTNKRTMEGCPSSITLGHSVDDQYDASGKIIRKATALEQPPLVGYWKDWQVEWSKELNRYILTAVRYYAKADHEEAMKYPYASVEAFPTKGIIGAVSMDKRTPERPMHMSAAHERYKPLTDEKPVRYSMEPGMPDPLNPTAAPNAQAPDEEFQNKFMQCMAAKFPQLQAMHDTYAAPPAPPAAPGAVPPVAGQPLVPPAAPGAVPPAAPLAAGPPAKPADKKPPEKKEKHAMTETETAMQAEIDALKRQNREAVRGKELADKYGASIDHAKELADVVDMTPEQYAAHLTRLDRVLTYTADPTIAAPGLNGAAFNGALNKPKDKEYTAAHAEKAEKYMRDNAERLSKLNPEVVAEKAMKFAMTGKEAD